MPITSSHADSEVYSSRWMLEAAQQGIRLLATTLLYTRYLDRAIPKMEVRGTSSYVVLSSDNHMGWKPPNGLPITRAAWIDREHDRPDTSFQNTDDLVDAERRRVHGRVGPRPPWMLKS
jgi:hypothetical protein